MANNFNAVDKYELVGIAKEAMKKAYAPYSDCYVGAALLTSDGEVFTGCNIENASFSPTICAERAAFASAVSAGKRSFSAIAVAGGKNGEIMNAFMPCGVCRQVMREFCDSDFRIYVSEPNDGIAELTLADILPYSFGNENMG